jgi:outer membrane protein OmpA-like peptidoglycan-associated protein
MIVKSKGKNPYYNNLYRARFTDTTYARPEKVEIPVQGSLQQGVASFTPGEKKMFLTRWEQKEGKNIGTIYMSEKNASTWSDPVKLNGNVNIEGFSSIQPFVTGDGKYLVFASDRPGGVGKYDLWYCLLDAMLMPGSATNMGTTINTKDDEQAPYFHTPSSTFVFASNGRVGMGGYDLYKTNGDFRNWGEVKNLGYPVNSTKDDIYFFSKGKKYMMSDVYFSSDRNSVCCLEMYDAKKVNLYITGKVVDCVTKEPMVGAKISVVDTIANKVIYSQQLDATGSYSFELEEFQPLKLVAEKQYYYPRSFHFYKSRLPDADTLFNPVVCLPHEDTAKPYPVGKPVVMKDIYYDFDKATLRPESYPVLDTLAKVMRMYPKMEIEIGAHTDSKGTDAYNLKLSAARAKSCVDYLMKVGIEASRMYSKGFGESIPVAPNTTPGGKDNPDGRALNRRTEVKVLHY